MSFVAQIRDGILSEYHALHASVTHKLTEGGAKKDAYVLRLYVLHAKMQLDLHTYTKKHMAL